MYASAHMFEGENVTLPQAVSMHTSCLVGQMPGEYSARGLDTWARVTCTESQSHDMWADCVHVSFKRYPPKVRRNHEGRKVHLSRAAWVTCPC